MAVSPSTAEWFHPGAQQRGLWVCLAVSILLHAAVLFIFPGLREGNMAQSGMKVLAAKLAPVAAAPAVKEAAPTPPEPPPPLPEVKPKLPPIFKPSSKAPTAEPAPAPAPSTPQPATPSASVSQASAPASSADTTPRTGESVDTGSLRQYRYDLAAAAKRFKRYPAQAMQNGWEGSAQILIVIGPSGMIKSASIKTSSGHAVLDDVALDMIKKAQTRAPIPPALRGQEFSVELPVFFNLKDG